MSDAELIRLKDALILALAEKLAIVAEHLGRLSERPEVRGKHVDMTQSRGTLS